MTVARRRHLGAVLPFQHNLQLLQLRGTVQPMFRQNQAGQRFVGALRTGVRPVTVAARPQASAAELGLAFQMFVAGLTADCRTVRTGRSR